MFMNYNDIFNEEIYKLMKDLLNSNSFVTDLEKCNILNSIKSEDGISFLSKEYDRLKGIMESLVVGVNLEDSKRRQIKYFKFIKLAIYLLTDVRRYILRGLSSPDYGYECILNDYLAPLKYLETMIPGLETGIMDADLNHKLFVYSGHVSSDDDALKVDENTRFDVASVTKMFTALQLLKYDENLVYDISRPLNSYDDGFDIDASIESLAKFECRVVTDGRIDGDLSSSELFRRLYNSKVLDYNTHLYSDIPYIVIGKALEHYGFDNGDFFDLFKLKNTGYSKSGVLTGGDRGKLDLVHDPKARLFMKYGYLPRHAGVYSNVSDLIDIFDRLDDGFLSDYSIERLLKQDYTDLVVFDDEGLPIIDKGANGLKYRNVNRAMGVYIPHPYGIDHTDMPDVSSTKTFASSGFTGSYCVYDLDNRIAGAICTNPFSGFGKSKSYVLVNNMLKEAQFYYVYALRLFDNMFKRMEIRNNIPKVKVLKRG